jgi:thiopurine S-methyltransferase
MDTAYWHDKWQSNDIGFNQLQPNKLLTRYFPSLKCTPGCRIFVPLCGQSIDMLWLAGQGYHVIGVELSSVACDAFFKENKIPVKKSELGEFTLYRSDEVTLFSGDFFKLSKDHLGAIDAVYDRAALIALPEEARVLYSKQLMALMDPQTAMFLITTSYHQNEMQGPPFSVDEHEVTALYIERFSINQLYNKPFETPPHLQDQALLDACEQVFLLTKPSQS